MLAGYAAKLLEILWFFSHLVQVFTYINYTISGSSRDGDTTQTLSGANYFTSENTIYTINITNTDSDGFIKLDLSRVDIDMIEKQSAVLKWFDGSSENDRCYIPNRQHMSFSSDGPNIYMIFKTGSNTGEYKMGINIIITFTREKINGNSGGYGTPLGITLETKTSTDTNANTDVSDGSIICRISGSMGSINTGPLDNPGHDDFELGQVDTFSVEKNVNPGNIQSIQFTTTSTDGWNMEYVMVTDLRAGKVYLFKCSGSCWLDSPDHPTLTLFNPIVTPLLKGKD